MTERVDVEKEGKKQKIEGLCNPRSVLFIEETRSSLYTGK